MAPLSILYRSHLLLEHVAQGLRHDVHISAWLVVRASVIEDERNVHGELINVSVLARQQLGLYRSEIHGELDDGKIVGNIPCPSWCQWTPFC